MYKHIAGYNILCICSMKGDLIFVKIFGLQKLSLLDFPGKTACTVFTGGCNWRCPFCHNAALVTELNTVETLDEDEFFAFLKKRKGILEGVCITGGEPLMQPDIVEFIKDIRALGYPVKLDTNGSFPEKLKEVVNLGLVDYVAMDIKNSPESYEKTVGINNLDLTAVRESAAFLMSDAVDYEFRTTVVKEFHCAEDFESIAQWIQGAKRYYLQSFTDSGDIIGDNLSAHTKDELKRFKDILTPYIEYVELRGV